MDDLNQQTLVLIKPDAMARNLAGEIIARLQRVGLKIIDCRMVQADKELAAAHYPVTDEWLEAVGDKSLSDFEKYGVDAVKLMGTSDAKEIGKMIHQYNQESLLSGPVIALIFEGIHAIEVVRKLAGPTNCILAPAGTIRGDYSNHSALAGNIQKKPIQNLVHASGSVEEAKREIALWFPKK